MSDTIHPVYTVPVAEYMRVAAERDKLREYLRVYGGHIPQCPGRPCECGFAAAWEKAGLP